MASLAKPASKRSKLQFIHIVGGKQRREISPHGTDNKKIMSGSGSGSESAEEVKTFTFKNAWMMPTPKEKIIDLGFDGSIPRGLIFTGAPTSPTQSSYPPQITSDPSLNPTTKTTGLSNTLHVGAQCVFLLCVSAIQSYSKWDTKYRSRTVIKNEFIYIVTLGEIPESQCSMKDIVDYVSGSGARIDRLEQAVRRLVD
jgi:hypothetical protein